MTGLAVLYITDTTHNKTIFMRGTIALSLGYMRNRQVNGQNTLNIIENACKGSWVSWVNVKAADQFKEVKVKVGVSMKV